MKHKPTIAITGAGGFLGTALVAHFTNKGWNVIALVRDPSHYHAPTAGVTARQYDMSSPIQPDTLQGVNVLIHAAYIKLTASTPDAYERNLSAARNLLAAAKHSGVTQSIFISSMSAHDEAISVYGTQKLATEKLFLKQNATVLRPGLILGNGGIVKEMSEFMQSKHMVPLVDGGRQPLQVIALYDLVTAIDHAIDRNVRGLLTVATPEIYTYKTFYQELASALNTKVLYVPVPYSLLMGLFKLIALLHIPVGVSADNLKGLRMLRSAPTAPDLEKLSVSLDPLPEALHKLLRKKARDA